MFKKVAVFGFGLLGGSIAKGLREISTETEIVAIGRSLEKLKPALADGVVNVISSYDDYSLSEVDLVVVSVPVIISISMIRDILNRPDLEKHALVIDVGSVKGSIEREILEMENAARFVGCHPMAGSEKMGYEHSSGELYKNASVIIAPSSKNREEDIERISGLWRSLGARITIVSGERHDELVAYTSHLPHLVSSLVVRMLEKGVSGIEPEYLTDFIGNGFRDVSRIAAGSPDMWRDIIALNKDNINRSIGELIEYLNELREMVMKSDQDDEEIYDFLKKAKSYRDSLI